MNSFFNKAFFWGIACLVSVGQVQGEQSVIEQSQWQIDDRSGSIQISCRHGICVDSLEYIVEVRENLEDANSVYPVVIVVLKGDRKDFDKTIIDLVGDCEYSYLTNKSLAKTLFVLVVNTLQANSEIRSNMLYTQVTDSESLAQSNMAYSQLTGLEPQIIAGQYAENKNTNPDELWLFKIDTSDTGHIEVKINLTDGEKYTIEVQEGCTKKTISFTCSEDCNKVNHTVWDIWSSYIDAQKNGPSEILNAPSADEAAAKFENYAEATLAEMILGALKQANIVDENVTVVKSPGFLRRVWNAFTSKWVTIPVGMYAAAVAINVMCTLAK